MSASPVRKQVIASLSVAVILGTGAWVLMKTGPSGKRAAVVSPPLAVEVMSVEPASYPVRASGFGMVRAVRQVELRPQVGGRVLGVHANFEPGGFVPANETIVQIDAADYRLAFRQAETDVLRIQAELDIEMGRQIVAKKEFEIVSGDIKLDPASRPLALREPQLRQVQAQLARAKIALERARLDLDRTRLRLPYDVVVLDAAAVQGELASSQSMVGRVARADRFWLELRVPQAVLAKIRPQGDSAKPILAEVRRSFDRDVVYRAEIVRVLASLDEDSRLGTVLLSIEDPLSRHPDHAQRPALRIGTYAQAVVDAGRVEGVVRAPRRALRENQTQLVADADDRLAERQARVVWEDADLVYFSADGFQPGDRLIVSRVSKRTPGTTLSVRERSPLKGEASGKLSAGSSAE